MKEKKVKKACEESTRKRKQGEEKQEKEKARCKSIARAEEGKVKKGR